MECAYHTFQLAHHRCAMNFSVQNTLMGCCAHNASSVLWLMCARYTFGTCPLNYVKHSIIYYIQLSYYYVQEHYGLQD